MDYYSKDTWSALAGHSNAFLASVDKLLSLVARLSMLAPAPRLGSYARDIEQSQIPMALKLKAELENWRPPKAIPSDASNTAEAMRHAALLFYHKLATNASSANDQSEIKGSCQEIVRCIDLVSIDSPAAASHLWPLYMAGCFVTSKETASHEGQEYIRCRLKALKSKRGVKTVDIVRERLELIWERDPGETMTIDAPLILV